MKLTEIKFYKPTVDYSIVTDDWFIHLRFDLDGVEKEITLSNKDFIIKRLVEMPTK